MKLSLKLSLLLAMLLLLITSSINLAIYVNRQTDAQISYLSNTSIPTTMAILSLDTHISYAKHYLIQYVNANNPADKSMYEFQIREISKQISNIIEANKNSFEDDLSKKHWIQFSDALATLINSQNQVLKKHNSNSNAAIYLDAFYNKNYAIFIDALITMRTYTLENMNKSNITLQNNIGYNKNILLTIFILCVFTCIIISIYIFKLSTSSANIATKRLETMAQYISNNQFKACRKMAKENSSQFVENVLNKLDEIIHTTAKEIKRKQHALAKVRYSLKVLLTEKSTAQNKANKMLQMITAQQNLVNNFHTAMHGLSNKVELAKNSATSQINEIRQYTTAYEQLSLETPNITQYIRIVVDFSLYSDIQAKDLKVDMQQTIKNIKALQEHHLKLITNMKELHEFAKSLKQLIHPLNKSIAKNQQLASSDKKMHKANSQTRTIVISQAKHMNKTKELYLELTNIIVKLEKKIRKNLHDGNKAIKYIADAKNAALQSTKVANELQAAIIDTKDKLKGAKDVLKIHTSKSTLLKISLMQLNTSTIDNFDNISKINMVIADINSQKLNLQQEMQQSSNC